MPESEDSWRTIHQQVPLQIYERWLCQLRRIAIANGISAESLDADDKFKSAVGPRVQVYEILTLLCERTESDETFRV